MKKAVNILAGCFAFAATFSGCTVKDDLGNTQGNSTSTLQVKMTDNPAVFSHVFIDIRSVMINLTDDAVNGWTSLSTNAGVYDLLTLQNGRDTILATGTLTTATVKQIRFVLGTDNTVQVGDLSYPLTIPSGAESGLKINLNKSLTSSLETVVIDFDANASIHAEPDGSYTLRPVLLVRSQ